MTASVEKVLYLIGSLRNSRVPELANRLRKEHVDVEVFDDWYAAGPEADDHWKAYEQNRSRSYQEALRGAAAKNVFAFDKRHLDRCTHALLVLPAGKSGHMEIMYATYGVGAKTAILLDPEDVRWDVMYQFVPTVLNNDEEIGEWLTLSRSSAVKTSGHRIDTGYMTIPKAESASFPKTVGTITQEERLFQLQPSPQFQERNTTEAKQEWSWYLGGPLKDCRKYSASEPRSMPLTTGAAVLSTADLSGRHSVISPLSTTVKTSTRKAASRTSTTRNAA